MIPPQPGTGAFSVDRLSPKQQSTFRDGTRLFNGRKFWEAHEAWEEIWKEIDGPGKRVIQGLIQAAAAYHLLLTRPRLNGAIRNIEKSLGKFDGMPDMCFGIAIHRLAETLRRAHAEAKRVGQDGLRDLGEEYVPTL